MGVGGAEMVCENLSRTLITLGHQVIIISLYADKTILTARLEREGNTIIYLDKRKGFDFNCILKLRKIIKKINPDVIHTHLYALKYAILANIGLNVPVIHTVHNIAVKESTQVDRKINKIIYKFNRAVPVALSEEIKDTIILEYKLPESRVPIIYNGIDLGNCILKKDYDLHNPVKIIHVGRFYEQKNHKCLINAIKILSKEIAVHLDLYGDGPLMEGMSEYSNSLGLNKAITFHGVSSDIFTHLSESDIFVLPSKWEGMPMSVIEAMGTGLPIVATCVGGIPDMIDDKKSGILISPTEDELKNAIIELVNNCELRESVGRGAQNKSVQFSAVNMAKKYLLLYGERN